jgi:uncharacterized surface anchored protein
VGGASAHGAVVASVTVNKVDSSTQAPLAGATFSISCQAAETGIRHPTDSTQTTGASGQVVFTGVPLNGICTVTETVAPTGYNLADPASQQVNINSDQLSPSLTFTDVAIPTPTTTTTVPPTTTTTVPPTTTTTVPPTTTTTVPPVTNGTLVIDKKSARGVALAGAVFAVSTETSSYTTDANGTVSVSLPAGSYTVSETGAPSGYAGAAAQKGTVSAGASTTLTFVDSPLPAPPAPVAPAVAHVTG